MGDESLSFVKFFSVNCVRSVDDLVSFKSYEKLIKWIKTLQEIASVAGGKPENIWAVLSEGKIFIIASGSSQMKDGRKYNACSAVSRPQDADKFAKVLKAGLS